MPLTQNLSRASIDSTVCSLRLGLVGGVGRRRQLDVHALLQHRRDQHHDDEQHQHDVNERVTLISDLGPPAEPPTSIAMGKLDRQSVSHSSTHCRGAAVPSPAGSAARRRLSQGAGDRRPDFSRRLGGLADEEVDESDDESSIDVEGLDAAVRFYNYRPAASSTSTSKWTTRRRSSSTTSSSRPPRRLLKSGCRSPAPWLRRRRAAEPAGLGAAGAPAMGRRMTDCRLEFSHGNGYWRLCGRTQVGYQRHPAR